MFHDVIPWDDDFDLMVDHRDYPKLKRTFQNEIFFTKYNIHGFWDRTNEYDFDLLNQTFPDIEYEENINNMTKPKKKFERFHAVKIFSVDQKAAGKYPWKFPFIDIFFFKQNLTHIWQLNIAPEKMITPISQFYPFHLRPCVGMWLPVPHKTAKHLKHRYRSFKCRSHLWNHEKEESIKPEHRVSVPCGKLKSVYVNIKRTKYGNGTLESVFISKELVYSVFIHEELETW